jgi:hypothetical protein
LYFTDKELDYSRVHEHTPKYGTIDIQLVTKSDKDIERVLKYMNKTKKCRKDKSKMMNQNLVQQNIENKPKSEIRRLSIFDFKSGYEMKLAMKSK